MRAILFHIGSIPLYSYGLMLGLGVIAALVLFWFLCKHFKVDEKVYNFYWWNSIVAIAFGLFGAWAFQQVYDAIAGNEFDPAGFTFFGGLILGAVSFVLGVVFFAKQPAKNEFFRVINFAAPCVVIAHALGRIGCFLAGCCYGIESEHGLHFPDGGPRNGAKVLPTQLYEALFLFALFGVMMLLIFKFKKIDFMMILYGAAYAVFRFTIEFWRGDYRGGVEGAALSPSQWQSFVLLAAVIALAVTVFYFKKIPFYKPIPETEPAVESDANEPTEADEFYEPESTSSKSEKQEKDKNMNE